VSLLHSQAECMSLNNHVSGRGMLQFVEGWRLHCYKQRDARTMTWRQDDVRR